LIEHGGRFGRKVPGVSDAAVMNGGHEVAPA
jgi:hypothetical protein